MMISTAATRPPGGENLLHTYLLHTYLLHAYLLHAYLLHAYLLHAYLLLALMYSPCRKQVSLPTTRRL
jgi:hypothetical protein